MLKEVLGVEKDYFQENGHEAFPVVSLLWFQIMTCRS